MHFENKRAIIISVLFLTDVLYLPVWWNWQTRWTQNPVVAIPYRFDPDHRHHVAASLLARCFSCEKQRRFIGCHSFFAKRHGKSLSSFVNALAVAWLPTTFLRVRVFGELVSFWAGESMSKQSSLCGGSSVHRKTAYHFWYDGPRCGEPFGPPFFAPKTVSLCRLPLLSPQNPLAFVGPRRTPEDMVSFLVGESID